MMTSMMQNFNPTVFTHSVKLIYHKNFEFNQNFSFNEDMQTILTVGSGAY